jgi:hypothetical protein
MSQSGLPAAAGKDRATFSCTSTAAAVSTTPQRVLSISTIGEYGVFVA